jgi:hypothetical protein
MPVGATTRTTSVIVSCAVHRIKARQELSEQWTVYTCEASALEGTDWRGDVSGHSLGLHSAIVICSCALRVIVSLLSAICLIYPVHFRALRQEFDSAMRI